jgi:hypothetical protein
MLLLVHLCGILYYILYTSLLFLTYNHVDGAYVQHRVAETSEHREEFEQKSTLETHLTTACV